MRGFAWFRARSPPEQVIPRTGSRRCTTPFVSEAIRSGDTPFTVFYDHMVPNTYRVANRMDLVPKLPALSLYDHVSTPFELNGFPCHS